MLNLLHDFTGPLANARFTDAAALRAHLLAAEVRLRRGLEEFSGLYATRAVLYPHQVAVAHTVLNVCPKGALLADEVGLGKTIEAGLILKELHLRGLAGRVLIAAPQHLMEQWAGELREKFDLPCVILNAEERRLRDLRGEDWWSGAITLVSLQVLARLAPHRLQNLQRERFDVLVVDEAHRARNKTGRLHRTLACVPRDRTLLLTATPVQTRLADLLSLLELIDPYALTEAETRDLSGEGAGGDDLGALRERLRTLMIRNRRADVQVMGLRLPERRARTLAFDLPPEEATLRDAVRDYTRDVYERAGRRGSCDLMALQRLTASHPRALEGGLRRRLARAGGAPNPEAAEDDEPSEGVPGTDAAVLRELVYRVSRVVHAEKAAQLTAFLRELLARQPHERVIVFSEFLDTIEALGAHLRAEGFAVHTFHGGLDASARRETLAEFWASGQVLLLSEAGSEGQNLQRAHLLVNFDLPWNPMRLEQRIGRVHRIGQTREVEVFNLAARGTIEERLLEILQRRINLFEDTIGDLDAIVGELEGGHFEAQVLALALAPEDEAPSLAAHTEEHVRLVAQQYRLADSLDRRAIERFDLSLRERYLDLDARGRAGLDHLPLRRFLRAALPGVPVDADVFDLPTLPRATLSPRVAADGEGELIHPLHPAVRPLLDGAVQDAPCGRVSVALSGGGLTYPPEVLGQRGLMVSVRAAWEGNAQDEVLLHLFVDAHGTVRADLGDHFARAELVDAPHLPAPDLAELRFAEEALHAALPGALGPHRERLEGRARARFELLARNIEAYYTEQIERLEFDFADANRLVRNARLELHHAERAELRDHLRAGLRDHERRRDALLRDLPDRLMALAGERDAHVASERARLRLDEHLSVVAVTLVEFV